MIWIALIAIVAGAAYLFVQRLLKRPALKQDSKELDAEAAERLIRQGFTASRVPENLDAIIIGSGMGGLTTAVMLARAGKRVLVLEQHDVIGGTTHVFSDKGFEFDTGLHYIGGNISDTKSTTRKMMDMVTDGRVEWADMHGRAPFIYDLVVDASTGFEFGYRAKRQNVIDDLLKHFPEEKEAITKYFELVKRSEVETGIVFVLRLVPSWLASVLSLLPMVRRAKDSVRRTTLDVLSELTKNQKLISTLTYLFGDYGESPSRSPWMIHSVVAKHYLPGASYPVGGPERIAHGAVQVIEKYGGKALVRAPVGQIIIEGGRAVGVKMQRNDTVIRAPIVVSACGVFNTYTRLIADEDSAPIAQHKESMLKSLVPSTGHLTVFAGFDGDGEELKLPSYNTWYFENFDFDNLVRKYHASSLEDAVKNKAPFGFISFPSMKDPDYKRRHPGKSTCHVITEAPYHWFVQWETTKHKHRGADYDKVKQQLTDQLLDILYLRFPQLKGKLIYSELGTSLSNNTFLNAYQGASYGLAHTRERFQLDWLRPQTPIPGLYLSGQDVASAGICGALIGGVLCTAAISKTIALQNAWIFVKG